MRKKKQPVPYWKKSHKCWYLKKDDKHIRLDPDRDKAWDEYRKIMAGALEIESSDPAVLVLGQFMDWTQKNRSPGTYDFYRSYIDHFSAWLSQRHENLPIRELKPIHVMRWVDEFWPAQDVRDRAGKVTVKAASPNTRHNAARAVQRACNWAMKAGLIEKNPVQYVEKDTPVRRETYLWPHEYAELLTHIKDEFIDVVETLRHTGCRPQELRLMEAKWFDRQKRYWAFPRDRKLPPKLRGRVVHLNETAYAISCKWASRYPEGPMFRNTDGNPWRKNAFIDRCRRLREKVTFEVTPYSIRHTFATDALLRGVNVIEVRHLMGHTSIEMLDEIYQHIELHGDALKASLEKATAHLKPKPEAKPEAQPNAKQEAFVLCRVDENGSYVPVAKEQAAEIIKALQ